MFPAERISYAIRPSMPGSSAIHTVKRGGRSLDDATGAPRVDDPIGRARAAGGAQARAVVATPPVVLRENGIARRIVQRDRIAGDAIETERGAARALDQHACVIVEDGIADQLH